MLRAAVLSPPHDGIMARLRLTSSLLPPSTQLLGFEGREALSALFAFEVWFVVEGPQPEPPDLVGQAATIAIDRLGALESMLAPHLFAGVFSSVELLVELTDRALYRGTVVPRLAFTDLSFHSRIWTKTAIKDALIEVLTSYGLSDGKDFEFRISQPPPTEEHVCQYKESDYAFFSRWLEREGWYFFFEHEEGAEKLVIVDDKSAHVALRKEGAVRYFAGSRGTGYAAESFEDFACSAEAVPGGVTVSDYDYASPQRPLSHNANVPGGGASRMVHYGARAFTSADVTRVATIRAEQLNVRQHLHRGVGAATQIVSGSLIEFEEHPIHQLNRSYLVIEARHTAWEPSAGAAWGDELPIPKAPESYRVEVVALPAEVQYRHPDLTPWPRVDGFELAVVDGAATSQYAQIDGSGCYSVKFKFDERTLKDGKASTRVRMMQPHGGSLEGWHFPLRKATEVICSFLAGDVDRPIIQAVVPNTDTPSPVTAKNQSQNVLHTGGNTYMTLEDQKGSEFINLFTPKSSSGLFLGTPRGSGGRERTSNAAPIVAPKGPGGLGLASYSFDLRTDEGNAQLHTGKNMDVRAHGQLQVIAGQDTNVTVFGQVDKDVIGNADEKYAKTLTRRVAKKVTIRHDDIHDQKVLGVAKQTFHDTLDMCVTDAADQTMVSGWCEEITGSPGDLDFQANRTRTIVGPLTLEVSPDSHIHVGGDCTQTITGGRTEKVAGKLKWDVGGKVTMTTLTDVEQSASSEWETAKNAVELTMPFKFDNTTVVHNEKWTAPHIELCAALASATTISWEQGISINLTLRGGGQAAATGAKLDLLGVYIAMMAQKCHLYGNMSQIGLLCITAKGSVKVI